MEKPKGSAPKRGRKPIRKTVPEKKSEKPANKAESKESLVRKNKRKEQSIRSRLPKAMGRDRHAILRQLDRLRSPKISLDKKSKTLSALQNQVAFSLKERKLREKSRPSFAYPEELPISGRSEEIVEAIQENQVVVITGETGSGKTTQIPKMCLAAGRGVDGLIGCTQPRRVAAVTVAQRIAEELGEDLGKSVGYKIRFKETGGKSEAPFIKIMTDGVLLAEFQHDPFFTKYDTIIVDEAHERSLNIDFILGILKNLLPKRPDLKVIITSATIDTEKFSKAFNDAPIVEVSGRMYPVEVRYEPLLTSGDENSDAGYVDGAVRAVETIFSRRPKGDILVFMPTESDIRETCDLLQARRFPNALILPLFGRLAGGEQARVFARHSGIKVVVATNVAETSITIPGIRYVVDTGLARISRYSPRTGTTSLPVDKISKSSADQRMGRCGRVAEGICIRLYDEEDYESRPQFTLPEILRANLAEVILRMVASRLPEVHNFPFVDPPDPRSIRDGFNVLRELGALLDPRQGEKSYTLTPKGRTMARLPVDPRISAILIEAHPRGCLAEALIIASALCIIDPRERPAEKAVQADQAHRTFAHGSSDFLFYLNLWQAYFQHMDKVKSGNQMKKWSIANFLSYKRMREWRDVHQQLTAILIDEGFIKNTLPMPKPFEPGMEDCRYEPLHQSIASAYLSQVASKKDKNIYQGTKGREVMLFPGSFLFNHGGQWIVSAQMVHTSRLFARMAANILPEWLEEPAGPLLSRTYLEPHFEKNRGEVIAKEQVSLMGLIIIAGRPTSYGPINPQEATELFIQGALVECQTNEKFGFLAHNQKVLNEARDMEERLRRRDLVVDELGISRFYEQRLDTVYSIQSLKKIIKDKGGDSFLRMDVTDVMVRSPEAEDLSQYPNRLKVDGAKFKLQYRFDPGRPGDGVTIKIPQPLVSSVPPEPLEWVVPGLLPEKVTAMIKGLPKPLRVKLVPVNKTVDRVMDKLDKYKHLSMGAALSHAIHETMDIEIPAISWPGPSDLPPHLTARLAVTDSKGRVVRFGRDVRELAQSMGEVKDLGHLEKLRKQWEKTGIKSWDFGDLPSSIPVKKGAPPAYVCLCPGDDCVDLKIVEDKVKAQATHKKGVAALCTLECAKDIKHIKKYLALKGNAAKHAAYFGGTKQMEQVLFDTLLERTLEKELHTEEEFREHVKTRIPALVAQGEKLVESTSRIMEAFHKTSFRISELEAQCRNNKFGLAFLKNLRTAMTQLLPPNFPNLYDDARLAHMPRYLQAVTIRAERGLLDLDKDKAKAAQVREFEDHLRRLAKELGIKTTPEKRQAVEDFFWMIEEFKVSVFAQELKTPMPISPKRLQKRLSEIEMMV
ncbi:ATP-dependent helicase HrpA [Desulfatibacillum aliphaticivorans]|uniref:ATP-dependent helicase HrpA n=1 Tax=Desulfatibacillum aliphaticivorans TaxID=218208 RepID=B8FCF5_DESAL|nr:ATP-dependent RNA helicase HrpA [Desulfatibacillum aliphaticivorans]ACL05573.1 ATP-dependent helicase HrpA [Desulfatibacillum aliphaticivorans]